MKFTAVAVLAAAAGAAAWGNVTFTTEVVESFVTFCPSPTKITHAGKTFTITEATTLTITDCPCTVTKPVTTTPVVVCHTCAAETTPSGAVPTAPAPTTAAPVTAGAGKAIALSGAGLAGVLGLAAFVL